MDRNLSTFSVERAEKGNALFSTKEAAKIELAAVEPSWIPRVPLLLPITSTPPSGERYEASINTASDKEIWGHNGSGTEK